MFRLKREMRIVDEEPGSIEQRERENDCVCVSTWCWLCGFSWLHTGKPDLCFCCSCCFSLENLETKTIAPSSPIFTPRFCISSVFFKTIFSILILIIILPLAPFQYIFIQTLHHFTYFIRPITHASNCLRVTWEFELKSQRRVFSGNNLIYQDIMFMNSWSADHARSWWESFCNEY